MSITAWADIERQNKYHQDAEQQRAIDIFQSLLEGRIDPDSAAGTIASIYEPLLKRDFKVSPVAAVWGILIDAVREFGCDRELSERMIRLLNSISKLPDVLDEHGNTIFPVMHKAAGVYWRDLPEFTLSFREYAIDIEDEDETEGGDWAAQAVPLLNATTFGAMYLASGTKLLAMPWHAEVHLMYAIESSCHTNEGKRKSAMYVIPAATWVLLGGEKIYELCKADFDRIDAGPRSGFPTDNGDWLWGKGRGYSLERWAFWKKRFSEVGTSQELSDSAKDICGRASSEMERVEASSQHH